MSKSKTGWGSKDAGDNPCFDTKPQCMTRPLQMEIVVLKTNVK